MRRVVVIGYGLAGHHLTARLAAPRPQAVDGAAARVTEFSVTVLGAEGGSPYNRVLLPEVLAGRMPADRIDLAEPDDPRVAVRSGVRATAIDRDARVVHGDDGSVVPYDDLVLATGANPVLPPLAGVRGPDGLARGVHSLRALADLDRLETDLRSGRAAKAVVVGGGLLGLQCARALTLRGLEVVLVHQGPHLLDHRLDAEAAAILGRTARSLGVELHFECRARALTHGHDGRLAGVRLADGYDLPADLVLLACGSAPATGLAARAGLEVRRGIVVDAALRSVTDPRVRALGDCARPQGAPPAPRGLAVPVLDQAEWLAADLLSENPPTGGPLAGDLPAGDVPAGGGRYQSPPAVARLTATGIDIAILGAPPRPGMDRDARTVRLTDPLGGTHRSVTLRDGRLIGSVLIGDVSAAGRLAGLLDHAGPHPLPENPLDLLLDPSERT
ncbi:MAG TPA: FAD-dependent oxidoreductase [Actinocrinis sp.]|nr:FAD-dependent oxidoreductase [Actinocrinis sp.]